MLTVFFFFIILLFFLSSIQSLQRMSVESSHCKEVARGETCFICYMPAKGCYSTENKEAVCCQAGRLLGISINLLAVCQQLTSTSTASVFSVRHQSQHWNFFFGLPGNHSKQPPPPRPLLLVIHWSPVAVLFALQHLKCWAFSNFLHPTICNKKHASCIAHHYARPKSTNRRVLPLKCMELRPFLIGGMSEAKWWS